MNAHHRHQSHRRQDRLLQAIDVTLAFLLLLVLSPLMILLAASIAITGGGSPLFGHRRYGKDGRTFLCYKFKSMAADADARLARLLASDPAARAEWHRDHKLRRDPRVTPIGRFIRKTSLDELPQLFNVLKGEMSIVGPRPHAVAHNEEYSKIIGQYYSRHRVKPGITGWAQVHGYRGETDTPEKMAKRVQYDLYYIDNWSLLLDLRILVMTVFVGFVNRNAY